MSGSASRTSPEVKQADRDPQGYTVPSGWEAPLDDTRWVLWIRAVDSNGRADLSRPIRRLTETEALALLRPAILSAPPPMLTPAGGARATEPLA